MTAYVIIKHGTPLQYVAQPGSQHSYTRYLQDARTYPTRDAAERDRCPENEIVMER